MDERARWENRYQQAGTEPYYGREPSSFLVRSLPLLPPPGRCLDVAGGEGRNALFLAKLGWRVTLVDVALAGIATARRRAAAARRRLDLVAADTANWPLRQEAVGWDLILVINYHSRELLALAARWLRPGGALVAEGFAQEQLGRSSGGPKDPELLWRPNELARLLVCPGATESPLRLVWYEDHVVRGDDNPRHRGEKWVVRLVARRLEV